MTGVQIRDVHVSDSVDIVAVMPELYFFFSFIRIPATTFWCCACTEVVCDMLRVIDNASRTKSSKPFYNS